MKPLVVHNVYQQPGGEDGVVTPERDLLSSAGHRLSGLTQGDGDARHPWGHEHLLPP